MTTEELVGELRSLPHDEAAATQTGLNGKTSWAEAVDPLLAELRSAAARLAKR